MLAVSVEAGGFDQQKQFTVEQWDKTKRGVIILWIITYFALMCLKLIYYFAIEVFYLDQLIYFYDIAKDWL